MHDRQPQSGAFGFSGEVRSEDGIKLICRNSLTAVGNADFHARAAFAVFPALAIFLTVLAFNLLGDGLRDALDPKIKG